MEIYLKLYIFTYIKCIIYIKEYKIHKHLKSSTELVIIIMAIADWKKENQGDIESYRAKHKYHGCTDYITIELKPEIVAFAYIKGANIHRLFHDEKYLRRFCKTYLGSKNDTFGFKLTEETLNFPWEVKIGCEGDNLVNMVLDTYQFRTREKAKKFVKEKIRQKSRWQ